MDPSEEFGLGDELSLASVCKPSPGKKQKLGQTQSSPSLQGLQSRQSISSTPKGPANLSGLLDWPGWVITQVTSDANAADRFLKLLRRPVEVTSAYSGLDAPRECLTQLSQALLNLHEQRIDLNFKSACDMDALPQAVLCHIATVIDGRCSCVFSDLEDRLTMDVRRELDQLMPAAHACREEKQQAFAAMHDYLMRGREWIFPPLATSMCKVHGKQCRVSPEPNTLDNDRLPTPLKLHFAGTTCVGWSQAGKQERFSHVSERTFAVWLSERKIAAERECEDIAFQECVVGFPSKDKIREPLWDTHSVITVRTGPEVMGWPTSRPRRFTAAINRRRWQPEDNLGPVAGPAWLMIIGNWDHWDPFRQTISGPCEASLAPKLAKLFPAFLLREAGNKLINLAAIGLTEAPTLDTGPQGHRSHRPPKIGSGVPPH